MIDALLEMRRKLLHLLAGIIIVVLLQYNWVNYNILGSIIILLLLLFIIAKFTKSKTLEWTLNMFERPSVRHIAPGKGALFYMAGVELSIILFPKDVAMVSILILAIGDSIPTIVGMYSKRIRHPLSKEKYLEGALIGGLFAFLAALIVVKWYEALLATIVALTFEAIDFKIGLEKIDDNLIVPLAAGVTINVIRFII